MQRSIYTDNVRWRACLITGTLALVCASCIIAGEEEESHPLAVFLTWQQDPTSTMTIDWHTHTASEPAHIEYKKKGSTEWSRLEAESHDFPFSDRWIHRVELTGLDADVAYRFRFPPYTRAFYFRTMPENLDQPIRFAAGGDVRGRREWMERTSSQVMKYEPDFIIWGGDLAYANALPQNRYRWYEWFDVITNTLVADDGRAMPVLLALGNHEVLGGHWFQDNVEDRVAVQPYSANSASREEIAPFFFNLFAAPGQPGYIAVDFADYMSIVILDSDHANPVQGRQTEWLRETLEERRHIPHVFPVYHISAYPSVRSFTNSLSTRVRENWVPLFEMYGVRTAFENHDHAYKRTYPILENEVDPDGVVYVGDGAWGVHLREIGQDHEEGEGWYLEMATSQRHAIIGTIQGLSQHYMVINESGAVIDEFER